MTAWHERWSPTWWAAWTFALTRLGRLDDEEVPEALADAARGVWTHYPPWRDARGHDVGALDARPAWDARPGQHDDPAGRGVSPYDPDARRPTWPAVEAGQRSAEPTETDGCRLHDGRCSGACEVRS